MVNAGVRSSATRGLGPGLLLALSGSIAFSGKTIIVKLGYRYGVDATVSAASATTELADPGKLRLNASTPWMLSFANLLTDRPAPFEFNVTVSTRSVAP